MKEKVKKKHSRHADRPGTQPYVMRLPGFIVHEEVGLGDVIKRVTYAMGIKPCAGCEKRAAAMNCWMVFHSR